MKIVVGISGSIGVLGIHALLVQLANEPGVKVDILMTRTAAALVHPGAIGALVRRPVVAAEWDERLALPPGSLVDGADALLVAPASATTIGLCANGIAANLVAAAYLSCTTRRLIAPVMSPTMRSSPAVAANLDRLRLHGAELIDPGVGIAVTSGAPVIGALPPYAVVRECLFRSARSRSAA